MHLFVLVQRDEKAGKNLKPDQEIEESKEENLEKESHEKFEEATSGRWVGETGDSCNKILFYIFSNDSFYYN